MTNIDLQKNYGFSCVVIVYESGDVGFCDVCAAYAHWFSWLQQSLLQQSLLQKSCC